MKDKGGRRFLADRRQFTHTQHFPERRAIRFRRSGMDRRDSAQCRYPGSRERRKTCRKDFITAA